MYYYEHMYSFAVKFIRFLYIHIPNIMLVESNQEENALLESIDDKNTFIWDNESTIDLDFY